MTTRTTPVAVHHPLELPGLTGWLTTVDHKRIGILYVTSAFAFFLVGGLMAEVMRTELAAPGLQIVGEQGYDQLFTMHGTIMLLLFGTPMAVGLGNVIMPLQIGADDMAFPRLNALSFWVFLTGALIVMSSFLVGGGPAAIGWTGYAPLSGPTYEPGVGVDLWIVGLLLTGISTVLGAINFVATVYGKRAPGMTLFRMPIFTWNILVTGLLILFAFPPLTAALAMLFIDRHLGGAIFEPQMGGSAILWQHLFWFFGHPEVYILILPFFGVITEIVSVFSRKPVFGYSAFVFATIAIASLSMSVWAHHMFTTGAVSNPFFSIASFAIAVPTGVKFFNWIGTMWRGHLTFETPMLWAIGFLYLFLLGGITGIIVASPPLDYQLQDTYFVVAHFHNTLIGGSVFAIFAGMYYWFPKMTGRRLSEGLGRVHFALWVVGFTLTFLPQYQLGLLGMPRRIADYSSAAGWTDLNIASTVGAVLLGLGTIPFLVAVAAALRRVPDQPPNPWGGGTLEWWATSPPEPGNFHDLPPIRSARPVLDAMGVIPDDDPEASR
ncbi:MAG TPA: cytochrome c oxidase subunit I [Candidatus Limnocylindrales bacterium]|nr:cytochrome c oxidase subunit I [Candidatus Limnocylindrales bacterium]